jgi:hypothetical protein
MSFWFVSVVSTYLNFATVSNDSLAILYSGSALSYDDEDFSTTEDIWCQIRWESHYEWWVGKDIGEDEMYLYLNIIFAFVWRDRV